MSVSRGFLVQVTWLRWGLWVAVAGPVMFVSVVATADETEPAVGRSRFLHEMETSEILMFRGQYEEAFRRCEHARDSLRRGGAWRKCCSTRLSTSSRARFGQRLVLLGRNQSAPGRGKEFGLTCPHCVTSF